jgi:ribonucleoside-diphosphate reductase beta chain
MSLLDSRTYYKPLEYSWAYEFYQLSEKMHWIPSEVKMDKDVRDWNHRLSDEERNFLTQIFRFFTQGDVDVAAGYYDKFIPLFPKPELRMMMGSFAAREAVHIEAYSLLIDTLGLPEEEYQAFSEYVEMANKHDYVSKFNPVLGEWDEGLVNQEREIARTLAVYPAFTEGLQLFSSFVMLLNFTRPEGGGVMTGMGEIVEWSIKDESLHVEGMIKLFEEFIHENPEIWVDSFRAELYQIARDMVDLEDKFIDLAFSMGGIKGLTPDEVKQYIRYIADRRLLQLGLKPNWGVKENPLPWVDEIVNSVVHTNFFEGRATEYGKGSLTGSWTEVWGEKV